MCQRGRHNLHTCHYLATTHRWRSGLAVAHLSSIAPLRDVNKNGLSDTRLSLSLANRSFEVFFSSRGSMYWHPSWNPRRYTGGAMRVPPRKFFFPNQRRLFFCRSRCLALVGTSYLDVAWWRDECGRDLKICFNHSHACVKLYACVCMFTWRVKHISSTGCRQTCNDVLFLGG